MDNKNELDATKLLEEFQKIYPPHKPSEKEMKVVQDTFQKFTFSADLRNMNLANFDGTDLIRYIEDSYRRYTTNIDVRPDIEDWQSVVHDQLTRNKVNAVLSKMVSSMPIAEIQPRGDEDIRKAQLVNEIYQYSEDVDDYEEFMVRFILEGIVKGTAIGYEGHLLKTQKIRNIKSGDGNTIKIEEGERSENKLFAEIVPLEEFYPSDLAVPRVKDLPYCFRRVNFKYSTFIHKFGSMYERSSKVAPKISFDIAMDRRPYWLDYISPDIPEGNVEMVFYYNRDTDEFVIIANGVWLNPLIINGQEEISPIPFNHKELPFFDIRFELFSGDFFYGKSLPDKLKVFQDVINVLTNMFLDQSFLTVFNPILTNGFDSIEDDWLRPGRRIAIDTQGMPMANAVMPLEMKTPGNWHQFILEYTRNIMEEASVDKVSSGQAGSGDRTTAQEIRVAAEGVSSLLGLFGRWVKYGIKRKCLLRTSNALQFWTDNNMAQTEGILGGGGSKIFKDAFKTIKVDNTTLSNGKRGTKVIGIFSDANKMPTAGDLQTESDVEFLASKKNIEYVAIDAEYIRNIDFDVKLVVNRKAEHTKDMEKALQMEKTRIYMSFFPDLVNKEELLFQLAEKMGDDPTKIVNENVLNNLTSQAEKNNPMLDNGVNKNPESNIMQNSMQSAMGKEAGVQSMRQLQSQMLG